MNIGQIAFYDEVKQLLLGTGIFQDTITTHLLSSLAAVSRFYQNLINLGSYIFRERSKAVMQINRKCLCVPNTRNPKRV